MCVSASAAHIDLLFIDDRVDNNEEMAYAINEEMASDYMEVIVNPCSRMRRIL